MHLRRIAVATLAGLLLSACSDDPPDPEATPTPTASSSPTPTETTAPSTKPESADAFIRKWFGLYVDLQKTGDGQEFRAAAKSCDACTAIADRFEAIYEAGGWIRGGEVSVISTKNLESKGGGDTWLAEIKVTPTRYKESGSSRVQTLEGGADTVRFVLRSNGGSYVVTELYQEST